MTTRDEGWVPSVHPESGLWITGLGTQYPSHLLTPERLEAFAERFYDPDNAGIKKLLEIDQNTGIETRSAILDYSKGHAAASIPTSLAEMDNLFRTAGVDMTVQACNKAIEEWGGQLADITHTVAVTCTNQGNPGYDVLVNERLGLSTSVERILLQGVGCAGGLAILRTAAQLAYGATMRGRAARILCFACELSTPNIKHELDAVANCTETSQTSIAAALFSDAAAAFILCNDLGLQNGVQPVLELLDWDHALIPGTSSDLEFTAEDRGYRTHHINMAKVAQKAVLICIDGWGVAGESSPDKGNAILNADTPWMDEFAKKGSKITQGYTELEASSLAVGLPEGLMGNSEVGHLNIGAGRVVWQDVVRIDQTIKKGELNKVDNIIKSF
ncbi:chalcone synthase B, partial [Aureobasidium melanogenum]